jgi:hypothetical protein
MGLAVGVGICSGRRTWTVVLISLAGEPNTMILLGPSFVLGPTLLPLFSCHRRGYEAKRNFSSLWCVDRRVKRSRVVRTFCSTNSSPPTAAETTVAYRDDVVLQCPRCVRVIWTVGVDQLRRMPCVYRNSESCLDVCFWLRQAVGGMRRIEDGIDCQ